MVDIADAEENLISFRPGASAIYVHTQVLCDALNQSTIPKELFDGSLCNAMSPAKAYDKTLRAMRWV
jgi:hypothetical protein